MSLRAEYYSDKSIAVYGDTRMYSSQLQQLGGKFIYKLRGGPGWIFQRYREPDIMQFIANVNAGLISPTATPAASDPTATLVPLAAAPVAMTPQDVLARLQNAQLMDSSPAMPSSTMASSTMASSTISSPAMPTAVMPFISSSPAMPTPSMPTTLMPSSSSSPAVPTPSLAINPQPHSAVRSSLTPLAPLAPPPVRILPAAPITTTYPNRFVAADGLTYQIIMYTVPVPEVNQRVTLTHGEESFEYTVTRIEKDSMPYDSIVITRVPEPVDDSPDANSPPEPVHSRAVVVNGVWKIHGMIDAHTLTFHSME